MASSSSSSSRLEMVPFVQEAFQKVLHKYSIAARPDAKSATHELVAAFLRQLSDQPAPLANMVQRERAFQAPAPGSRCARLRCDLALPAQLEVVSSLRW
jgi:hypothetical protein